MQCGHWHGPAADIYGGSDPNLHLQHHGSTYADAHTNRYPYADAHTNRHLYADAYTNRYLYADAHTNRHRYAAAMYERDGGA